MYMICQNTCISREHIYVMLFGFFVIYILLQSREEKKKETNVVGCMNDDLNSLFCGWSDLLIC